ncbi:MAG: hypothetical protein M0Z38_08430 [Deltaproteobacteria bacterium]|nr:hypothetical protein [Deltaproteobacteria bacterium]
MTLSTAEIGYLVALFAVAVFAYGMGVVDRPRSRRRERRLSLPGEKP